MVDGQWIFEENKRGMKKFFFIPNAFMVGIPDHTSGTFFSEHKHITFKTGSTIMSDESPGTSGYTHQTINHSRTFRHQFGQPIIQ